jgi:glycogen(starch) synthase
MIEVQRYAEVAAEIAKTFEFDIIHSHDWMTYPAGIAAMEVSQKPLVIHVHATEYDRSGENVNKAIYALELEGMQKANRVVTVSKFTKVLVAEKYKIPEDKIHVVHNGVATSKLPKVAYKSPLKDWAIVTFVGRITQQKGPLFFVEAARKVLTSLPETRFVLVGAGDLLPLMIRTVAKYGMSSRFHFTGFATGEDVNKIWSISRVYVMPSVSEPFGITPLEAARSGVPVIISNSLVCRR